MLIFLWLSLVALFAAGFAAVLILPSRVVPDDGSLTREKIIELRDKVRTSTAQIVGGFAVVVTFLQAIIQTTQTQTNINNNLKLKFDQETADLFSKSLTQKALAVHHRL